MFMQSNGGLTDARALPGQGRILSGPAGGVVGAVETARQAGLRPRSSASTWAAPRPTSRITTATIERAFETQVAGVRMRAPMMQHPHRGGGRRLDPAFRRRALSRRAGVRRRRSGAGLLSPRRAADRHRLQCDAGQAAGRISSPQSSGPTADQPHRCRDVSREKFAALAGGDRARDRRRPTPEEVGRGLPHHRRREHGQCDQGDLDRARP